MTRTIKFKAVSGERKTEITIRHTQKNAWTPDVKNKIESIKNEVYDLLRNQGFNYSEIKEG